MKDKLYPEQFSKNEADTSTAHRASHAAASVLAGLVWAARSLLMKPPSSQLFEGSSWRPSSWQRSSALQAPCWCPNLPTTAAGLLHRSEPARFQLTAHVATNMGKPRQLSQNRTLAHAPLFRLKGTGLVTNPFPKIDCHQRLHLGFSNHTYL